MEILFCFHRHGFCLMEILFCFHRLDCCLMENFVSIDLIFVLWKILSELTRFYGTFPRPDHIVSPFVVTLID